MIKTKRLILRQFKEEDANDFYEYMKLDFTAKHENFEPKTLEECKKIIERQKENKYFFAVELTSEHKVIGNIEIDPQSSETYEIAFDFNVNYSKKGYATEAAYAVMEYAFDTLDARRIIAECNDDNENSYKLLERLNFRREAHFIEDVSFKQDEYGNPIYVSSYAYAILKREFINQNKK
ncbi:GNAT family N-acetyltransferase [Breznakia pachnodae]|uniref:RimJ/RimL family protein N-acetyltransferase n=1 Tax=Breznakia pachnodae TaxID=265178 RepID=A0ABU0E7W0_9FIRM|nr:GNAT family N-acetyltransferase [Breznakia pachnodae]MDQ0362983.1 RimJ/RimL family protein N-acetyltransferase [Breznakia pachnodae]